ncbi:MAG: UDP-N-acetylglucosamine--N-acetylmuramyl-(pentapeptide) pyrophosphoryl-undecaprenol N-acetylglucosamine transferase, partial [Planctomycetota bacterium]
MTSDVYILAGGGSGGHLFPGLAVAEALREIDPAARVLFACSSRNIDRTILDRTPFGMLPQSVRPLPSRDHEWLPFVRSLAGSAWKAKRLLARLHPKGVLGLGGFAAAPVVWAAGRGGYRVAMLNPDAVPGKTNKLLARSVAAVFTQFESTAERFDPMLHPMIHPVGCPVRAELLSGDRAEAVKHFGLLSKRKTLLVFGGSQAAATINAAVAALLPELADLAERWQVLAVTGADDRCLASADFPLRVRCLPYCDRMDLAYAAADLVVCRAGASSVTELAATGTPAALMTYPWHKHDHQRHNAEPMAAAGGAVVCADGQQADVNAARLLE